MKRTIIFLLLFALTLSTFSGYRTDDAKNKNMQTETSTTAVTFIDDLGREVTVDQPERVAALIGSYASIWHLAGGIDKLAATTNATWTYFDLPLREDIINLGTAKEMNLEQLISCEPDLILASCGTDRNLELEESLEKMGLTTAYFSVNNFNDYLRMLKTCTMITGCEENYETYGTDIQKEVDAAIARADGNRPSVLYIRATGSSCKVKNSKNSVLGEMLADMNCINIADSDNSLLEQISMEKILLEDPDYIFVVLQSADPAEASAMLESTLLSNPAWSSLSAVKEGHYYIMDPALYNMKPNERWGKAYEQLADILYPEQ
ncbi:MAG: ABC transporter substrate-binding protein [Schaedlerella sp.]|nr:ABC transporter substrate-binding protein [Schaedlerella sp.]